MTKYEKRIYSIGYSALLAFVIASAILLTNGHRDVQSVAEESKTEAVQGGMPCEAPEDFREWYETYTEADSITEDCETVVEEETTAKEAKTSRKPCVATEEDESESETKDEVLGCGAEGAQNDVQDDQQCEAPLEADTSEAETVGESNAEESASGSREEVCGRTWIVNGEQIDRQITDALAEALERHDIGYWIEGSLAQIYQESHAQKYAVSKDGRDHGILQYRAQYWGDVSAQYGYTGADIYDVYVQFDIYAAQMAARFNGGLSVDEAISRHNTSDCVTTVNWEYVSQVKQWIGSIHEVQEY